MSSVSKIWPQLHQQIVELAESGRTDAVELMLAEHPEVRADFRLLLDCIQAEYAVWERRGQPRNLDEYARRFPEHADSLKAMFAKSDGKPPPTPLDHSVSAGPRTAETSFADATTANSSPSSELSDTYVPARAVVQPVKGKIGRYEILQEVARGGMGVVYKAYDPQLERMVAVKLIKSGELADPEQVQRFRTEARAAAQLHHSGIVPVYEVGLHESQHFLVMEFVEGRSLWEEVAASAFDAQLSAQSMQQVAEAVQFAHDRGIVHRDLKPQNIMLAADGRPRILDFGLAKRQKQDSNLTETGQILGTPSYMSPEQAQGQTDQIGPPSDVYSLGATLYFLLTGRPPFRGANQFETISKVVHQEPVAPTRINSRIPLDLETICLKCLQKRPEQRFASAQALADDLARFLRNEAIRARRPSRFGRAWQWAQHHRVAVLVVGLLVIQAAALVGWYLRKNVAPQMAQHSEIEPESSSDQKVPSAADSDSPPTRDMVTGDLRRELFDGRSLTGWRIVNGSFQTETAPDIGPVMAVQGSANCVFVDRDDEVLQDYRLQLTVYAHETDAVEVTFGEVGGEDVPRSSYSLVLTADYAYLEQSAADGRKTQRIANVSPFQWNPAAPLSIIIEQQHGWWFVSVDDSEPIVVPRGKREPLRLFRFQTGERGAAWIKSVQIIDLIGPPSR